MLVNIKATLQPDALLDPATDMGISLEVKKSSKLPNSTKPVQDRVLLPPVNRIPKPQDRSKAKTNVDPPRRNLSGELTKDTAKSSGNRVSEINKGKSVGDGELVKHMSNLPVYLKRVEKGEIFQDKVLNVGVLDWTRLEQWKHGQNNVFEKGSASASCSTSYSSPKRNLRSSRPSSLVHAERLSEEQSSLGSSLVSSRGSGLISSRENDLSQNVKGSVQNVVRFHDLEASSKSTIAGRRNVPQSLKSCGRSHSSKIVEKDKNSSEIGQLSGKNGSFGALLHPLEDSSSWDGKSKKTIEMSPEIDSMRTNTDQKIVSEVEAVSSKLGRYDVSVSSEEKKSSSSLGIKSRAQDLRQFEIDVPNQRLAEKGNSIVLLLPKESRQKGYREVFKLSQRRKSFDQNMTGLSKNTISDVVSTKEISSSKTFPEILHSSPLPFAVETSAISDRIRNGVTSDHNLELSSAVSHTFPCSEKRDLHSENKYVIKNPSDLKAPNASVRDRDPMETRNQEATELTVNNSRNPSPQRRLSFSLGRMGRSLSFKEGSTVPHLSSTQVSVKSGPVTSDAWSDCGDNPNKEKLKGHNRARSSPLRRLLDPILKLKEANPPHLPESLLQSKGSFNSFSGPVYSFPHEKIEESQVQALLQLKVNNGLPLFRFVVNNNSNILAATMKNLSTSGKDDLGRNYTFYLVNEIKKKSGGWISQGSKVKSCQYVYNVVGQMKVSISDFSGTSGQDTDQYILRESVLFGVERKQADQGSPKFIPNREIAAAVVKIPGKEMSHDKHGTDEESMEKGNVKCYPENQCSYNLGENGYSNNVTVVLPGAVHSSPNKGEPSPLIYRWKSGGSCDCGGWDVGCKLQVLSDQSKPPKSSKIFGSGPFSDCLELYAQGGAQQNRPILSLVPSKDGIYSVEYNTSISRLQAFFICVAVLSGQKVSDLSSVSNITESKAFDQSDMSGNNGYQVKLPAKYAPTPPLSPVGRV
ncbi:hypothetical protein PanWU01x14_358110 [Parasponia andersonii]|uniref:Uncharacterized protein n=1 Tax=Parasponia andersonii TaxID=3476 RepID=A0A2P5A8F0_PARAD|nr:hypothetical protein PanWU01x14_358110 [Parasponia andersonii]